MGAGQPRARTRLVRRPAFMIDGAVGADRGLVRRRTARIAPSIMWASRRAVGGLLIAAALAGCGGSAPGQALSSPSPSGDVSKERLQTMLLQSSDLPGLTGRRVFAAPGLTTQSTPQ